MLFTLFEFILYFTIFTLGDYSLYFITNKTHDILIKKPKLTSIIYSPKLKEWTAGNSISYIFIYMIYTNKIGHLYFQMNEYSEIYTIFSPFAYLFLQDFMFFLMHRTAHIPFLYKRIHHIHHKHRCPASWAGRISHIVDSNLENIAFTCPALIMPIHSHIWWACLLFTFIWGNILHDSTNKFSLKYINDNTDHCLHHYYGEKNYNFSYYFNHWDKLFGTYRNLRIKVPK